MHETRRKSSRWRSGRLRYAVPAGLVLALVLFVSMAAGAGYTQQALLTASDGAAGDIFGADVAMSGSTLVVSAPLHGGAGALYVYEKGPSGWADARQVAKLTASDSGGDNLGIVSIDGDTIVAGSSGHKIGDNDRQGQVYVFVEPAGGWRDATETAKLTASDGAAEDFLGGDVAVSGDTIVASASGKTVNTRELAGATYVFVRPASGWKDGHETAQLTVGDGAARELISRVAIDGDTIVVGSPNHQVGDNARQGSAYVFEKPATGWVDSTETAKLTSADGGANDQFGSVLDVSGDTIVVGAGGHRVGSHGMQGAAYVFVRSFFGWVSGTQTAELTASDGATNDVFGFWVALAGDTIAVGAPNHQVGANAGQGAAYLFAKPGQTWADSTETAKVTAPDGAAGDALGVSTAVSGKVFAAGAAFRDTGRGAVSIFGAPPEIAIQAPADGAVYRQGQAVAASYTCTSPAGASVGTCAGPVANGAPLDTSTTGAHTFAVGAGDGDGLTATRSVAYTVVRPGLSITGLRQSAKTWRAGGRLARVASRPRLPVGTTFSFTLSERARLTFSFKRRGGKLAGRVKLSGHRGANRVRFQGRLSRKQRLRPGRYRLRITATGSAGGRTTSRPLDFRIVKERR